MAAVSSASGAFESFSMRIGRDLFSFPSEHAVVEKANAVAKKVFEEHCLVRLELQGSYMVQKSAVSLFAQALPDGVSLVNTPWGPIKYVTPKAIDILGSSLERRYGNGVIEKVDRVCSEGFAGTSWEGDRTYPSGIVEKGRFEDFSLASGVRIQEGKVLYINPRFLLSNRETGLGLVYEGRDVIVIQTTPNSGNTIYTRSEKTIFDALIEIFTREKTVNEDVLKELFLGPVDRGAFVEHLFTTQAVFSLSPRSLRVLLEIIRENEISVDLQIRHATTGKTLLCHFAKDKRTVGVLLAHDRSLVRIRDPKAIFVTALLEGSKEAAQNLLAAMVEEGVALTEQENVFRKVVFAGDEVSLPELESLSSEDQATAYRLANTYGSLQVIRLMRSLGYARETEPLFREGPSILACNMDALEMSDAVRGFLLEQRGKGALLTEEEFYPLLNRYQAKGSDVGRILGRDYMERKIQELGLVHVKVPKKILVVQGNSVELQVNPTLGVSATSPENIQAYAEKIAAVHRDLTFAEVSELIRLFEATRYWDIHRGNIITSRDGVYVIDTEYMNFCHAPHLFAGGSQYAKMADFVHQLSVEEQKPLIGDLNEKIEAYRKQESEIVERENRLSQLVEQELVKTGCIHGPKFVFSLAELGMPEFEDLDL